MRIPLVLLALCLSCRPAGWAGELYSTDFEAFPVGDNQWAGTDGWLSNDLTSGAQGILANVAPDLPLGKTAYLGFEPPRPSNGGFTTVFRPINFDPVLAGVPILEFDSLLGIQDSTLLNGRHDRFFVSFYNLASDFLAALEFDTTTGNVLRCDGVAAPVVTGLPFLRGNQEFGPLALQLLFVRIDLVSNRWAAFLDGIPLFEDALFTATGAGLTVGAIAVEWLLSALGQPGDNWIWVADWVIRSAPKGAEPFQIDSITRSAAGETTLTWLGEPGFDYEVLWSDDLQDWHAGLPGSVLSGGAVSGPLSFTDDSAGSPQVRLYQVVRSPSP